MDYNASAPEWVDEFSAKYAQAISHAFILHFNVSDYVIPGIALKDFLVRTMTKSHEIVVCYNRAEGMTFPLESHRQNFITRLGLNTPQGKAEALAAGMGEHGPNKNDPRTALGLLTKLLRITGDTRRTKLDSNGNQVEETVPLACVIIDYADSLFPEGASSGDERSNLVLAQSWGRDDSIQASGNIVFLLAEQIENLASPLRAASSRWENITIPLPDRDTRLGYISWYLDSNGIETDLTPDQIANLTAFLQLVHIEDIFLRGQDEGGVTEEMIKDRKQEIIASEFADVLEIWEPTQGFEDIGGLEIVKNFFIKNVIQPFKTGKFSRIPKGVLMMGPAGTGKSVMAEAVAFESGVNAVQLNLSKIFDKFVGSTERNMEKILRALVSLSPVIVFIDEIDQSVNRGEAGDSGVSARLFKRLLEVMSDEKLRGKVVFLTATNRPDLMDAALKRPGRLDRKIAFFLPNDLERDAIIRVMVRRYITNDPVSIPLDVIENTNNWTGAELVELARKASELLEDEESPDVSTALFDAAARLCPTTQGIAETTAYAMAEINDLDLVPEEYRDQWIAVRKGQPTSPAVDVSMETLQPTQRQRRSL